MPAARGSTQGKPYIQGDPVRLFATEMCCCQLPQMCNDAYIYKEPLYGRPTSMQRQLSGGKETPFS